MEQLKVGIVGTGYAAKRRAEALQQDPRVELIAVSGNTRAKIAEFSQTYSVSSYQSWEDLVNSPELDLIIICTVNRDHGKIALAAIEAGKHVVVEYPLSLNHAEAEEAIAASRRKGKLLHVEHIELMGGLHQGIRQTLPEIGKVFYARYITIKPEHPAPRRWSYHRQLFGFPLTAALSRISRLTDLFGQVASVSCESRFWDVPESDYFRACLCNARLCFHNGVRAEVVYGKGETFWRANRTFEIYGEKGAIIFEGQRGTLVKAEMETPIEIASRRGLFAKDTTMVLDHLYSGKPLYVSPDASYYALKVADAARLSAETGETIIESPRSEEAGILKLMIGF